MTRLNASLLINMLCFQVDTRQQSYADTVTELISFVQSNIFKLAAKLSFNGFLMN